jgi:hypothetical protein
MAIENPNDDLLNQLKAEWQLLNSQSDTLAPLASELTEQNANHGIKQTLLVLIEVICYTSFAACIAFAFVAHKTPPFAVLSTIYSVASISSIAPISELNLLILAAYGVVIIVGALFITLGLLTGKLRRKKYWLKQSDKALAKLLIEFEQRKGAIESLERKYFLPLVPLSNTSGRKPNVNEIPNPGYDGAE